MAFSFRQILYFVAAAENGAVSRAAHELSISQSTVAEAIRELEAGRADGAGRAHARAGSGVLFRQRAGAR